jgi:signal transduction histidine kinase
VAGNATTRRATVTVRDHGEGLSPEALEHVFDRFWQADSARVGAGSGLGLSIVAGIATEHGGHATAANADGGGAVFTIELPLSPTR